MLPKEGSCLIESKGVTLKAIYLWGYPCGGSVAALDSQPVRTRDGDRQRQFLQTAGVILFLAVCSTDIGLVNLPG